MKIKLSKAQWEQAGKTAGWIKQAKNDCSCGSGLISKIEYDARGIELGKMCSKCKKEKLSKYRQDVLTNPQYEADEPIEPEE